MNNPATHVGIFLGRIPGRDDDQYCSQHDDSL
jgi:hypothetical protein